MLSFECLLVEYWLGTAWQTLSTSFTKRCRWLSHAPLSIPIPKAMVAHTIPLELLMNCIWTLALWSLGKPAWYTIGSKPWGRRRLAISSACFCKVTYTMEGPVRALRNGRSRSIFWLRLSATSMRNARLYGISQWKRIGTFHEYTDLWRKTGVRNTPAVWSMMKESHISLATFGVPVAVKQSTRSTSISSAKRAIFKYSGRKLAPHCKHLISGSCFEDSITMYLRYAMGLVYCE